MDAEGKGEDFGRRLHTFGLAFAGQHKSVNVDGDTLLL